MWRQLPIGKMRSKHEARSGLAPQHPAAGKRSRLSAIHDDATVHGIIP